MLRMVKVCMEFPGVTALDNVDFDLRSGEIHALLGQNGAGKSTLMKILAGEYSPTEGKIELNGEVVVISNPREARRRQIAIVHQELSVLGNLTVTENVCLGSEASTRLGVLNRENDRERTKSVLSSLGMHSIKPDTRVSELSLAERQMVEIAKAIVLDPEILVLDEPTASLSELDSERLFEILKRLRNLGLGIIFITHRLREVSKLCDRATLLRNGKVVTSVDVSQTPQDVLIKLILGKDLSDDSARSIATSGSTSQILEVENLVTSDGANGVNLTFNAGEIYGLTGLLGAGQNAVARAIFGLTPWISGTIKWKNNPLKQLNPRAAIKLGIAFLPEDRRRASLFASRSIRDNLTLPSLNLFSGWFGVKPINLKLEKSSTVENLSHMDVVAPSIETSIRLLSGGNQQKVLLSRWLLRDSELLVLQEPTHGVDVGARREIHKTLRNLASDGRSVLIISSEVSELLSYVDRIGVMYSGKLVAEFDSNASEAEIQAAVQGSAQGI